MGDNWDSIKGFDGWSNKLNELLEAAAACLESDDVKARVKVQKRLREFYLKSPNEFSRKLDEIAREAILNINSETTAQSLQAIVQRTNDLDQYTKDIKSITEGANRSASLISLESPQAIVNTLTDTIAAAKQIKGVFATAVNAIEIEKRINSMVNAIKKLREIIEDA